jgi:serine/threonine-protein kinase
LDLIAGKYEVIEKLGEGASGTVFRARNIASGSEYAVKILLPSLTQNERFLARFIQEAKVLERFVHPGSIQLRDFGKTEDGMFYMATDFCDGVALRQILTERKQFSVDETLDCLIQVLEVLHAAHGLGIIHRDLKPDNVLVESNADGSRRYRLLDFGVAKLTESTKDESEMMLTLEGTAVGTPQYMSPEQAAGVTDLDFAVDIYALGIMMYELLSGRLPFSSPNVLQILLMHSTMAPPPLEAELGIPNSVQQLIFKALEKNRVNRYSSAQEFADACSEVRAELLSGAKTVIQESPIIAAETAERHGEGGTKILCLDDDPMVLNILKHMLSHEGYTVYTTTDCASVHDLILNEEVRFMISDVQMPGLPGTKICRMLKEAYPDITIILFSSIDERDLEKRAAESNADGWMSKQASPPEWVAKIKSLMPD